MRDFEQRVDAIKDKVGMTDLDSNFTRAHGTVTCPFCGSRGKGWITNNSWFRCFKSSCGVQGNVISIYQQLNNYPTYGSALYALELEHGLTPQFRQSKYEERSHLLNQVLDIYRDELLDRQDVIDYLLERGISRAMIQKLKIGFAPYENKFLGGSDLSYHKLLTNKLVNFQHKDFFYNRIIFPIMNTNRELVHLSGRWFGELWNQCPKYKDSPAVPYVGSSKQYLLFEDYLDEFKNKGDTIVIAEGIPDTIVLNQQGVPAFGLLGLEKVTSHVDKLKDFKNIIAVFDTDRFEPDHIHFPNELKSWIRIIPQLVNLQCMLPATNFFTFTVPEGKDLNDFYLQGNTNLREIITERKRPFVSTLITEWGPHIEKHQDLYRIICATNQGHEKLASFIDSEETPLSYALKIFGG